MNRAHLNPGVIAMEFQPLSRVALGTFLDFLGD
jgi:hypothetical protein